MSDFTFFGNNHFSPYDYTSFKNKLATLINTTPDDNELRRIAATVQQQYSWTQPAASLYQLIQADMKSNTSGQQATKP